MKRALSFFVFLIMLLCLCLINTNKETPDMFLSRFCNTMDEDSEEKHSFADCYLKSVTEIYIRYEQQYLNHSISCTLNESTTGKDNETLSDNIRYRLSKYVYRHIRSDVKNGYVNLDTPFKEVPYEIYPPVLGIANSFETTLSKNEIVTLSQYFFDLFNEIGGTSTSKDKGMLDNIIVYPNGNFMFLDCYPSAEYQDEVYGAALYVKKHRGKYYLDTAYYFSQRLEYP